MTPHAIARHIKTWGLELGFDAVGVAGIALGAAEGRFEDWLGRGFHGEMGYMARHGRKRSRPALLQPEARSVIAVRLDYRPHDDDPLGVLADPALGYISRYALGRDYHKLMRKRLQRLGSRIVQETPAQVFRALVDSAPVLEKPLAQLAGLGWAGKHTNLVHPRDGGWFFLGELYLDLALPADTPATDHCGDCRACLDICPTQAIVGPYLLDARRCVSYLTIELHGAIALELRPLIGNRIYGCDDCLLACPWNRFAQPTRVADFEPRQGLADRPLLELFAWSEDEFLRRLEGSPIRRLGHIRWLRNIAVALGNGPGGPETAAALARRTRHPAELVREHAAWALQQLQTRSRCCR